MRIGEIIPADRVLVGLRAADKTHLLQELAGRAAAMLAVDSAPIAAALQAREDLGSTGLGKGFALPHARLAALGERFALFARLARPIDFDAIDGCPVDLVILLLTPVNDSEHLAALAALSRPLRDGRFLLQLRNAPDARSVHDLLIGG